MLRPEVLLSPDGCIGALTQVTREVRPGSPMSAAEDVQAENGGPRSEKKERYVLHVHTIQVCMYICMYNNMLVRIRGGAGCPKGYLLPKTLCIRPRPNLASCHPSRPSKHLGLLIQDLTGHRTVKLYPERSNRCDVLYTCAQYYSCGRDKTRAHLFLLRQGWTGVGGEENLALQEDVPLITIRTHSSVSVDWQKGVATFGRTMLDEMVGGFFLSKSLNIHAEGGGKHMLYRAGPIPPGEEANINTGLVYNVASSDRPFSAHLLCNPQPCFRSPL